MTQPLTIKAPVSITDGSEADSPPNAVRGFNPYLAARREWDERYGDLISRSRNWRRMALLSSAIPLVAVVGLVHLSTRSRIVPFVVAIDSLGRSVPAGIADQASSSDTG